MLILRKATADNLDFLIRADLESDGDTETTARWTSEERREHWLKIAAFVHEDEHRSA